MFGNLIPWNKKAKNEVKVRPDQDNPIGLLRQSFDELWDRFLDDWHNGLSPFEDRRGMGPHVDFDDRENEYVVRAQLPGFEPADIDVKVSGNRLVVRAEHQEEGKKQNGTYHHYGKFSESFTLPKGCRTDEISARYHSGILEVHLPKSEECQGKRIQVKSG